MPDYLSRLLLLPKQQNINHYSNLKDLADYISVEKNLTLVDFAQGGILQITSSLVKKKINKNHNFTLFL